MPGFQALPAPAAGDGQHRLRQGTEVVSHLLDGDAALEVTRQSAKNLGMMGPAQQVEQGFVIVFAGGRQGGAPLLEIQFEISGAEALTQHVRAGQLVNHTRVQQQVARRPAGRAQQAQQPLMDIGPLQQQRQVAFAAQQRLNPVGQTQRRGFSDYPLMHPLRCAGQQPHQPGTGLLTQCQHPRMSPPKAQPRLQGGGQLRQQLLKVTGLRQRFGAAVFALGLGATEQFVKFLRYQFPVRMKLLQQQGNVGKSQGLRNPVQVWVLYRQDMGLLVVKVLDAVLHPT